MTRPPSRPRCRYLGLRVAPAELARLGLPHIRKRYPCAKGHGLSHPELPQPVVCTCRVARGQDGAVLGCGDCPDYVPASMDAAGTAGGQ